MRAKVNLVILPYQSCLVPLPVEKEPVTTVVVYPEARTSQWDYPCCAKVTDHRQVVCPAMNTSKVRKTFKVGTCLGNYERVEEVADKVEAVIQNELLPHADHPGKGGDREGKVKELLEKEDWSHLTEEDRQDLFKLITKHNEAFILEKGELGQIQGPPVHISVSDLNPVRGPNYRYPEKAKAIIT